MENDPSDPPEDQETNRRSAIHAVLSFVIALGLLLAGVALMIIFVINKVQATQEEPAQSIPTVLVSPIEPLSHQVEIQTQGVVESRREVMLAAEVAGRVVSISPDLVDGGRVEEGELLVELDQADYNAALARAGATLAEARLTLEQERAAGRQAERDWEKLGRGDATPLVLREPQIASALARIESAQAEVERAERDLERTRIRAPFDGRVRSASVETGAVVSPGTQVAEIYSATELEVRLPVSLRDFGYLRSEETVGFELRATIGGGLRNWSAELDRIEGEVDRATLSGYVIARVLPANGSNPYPPVGLFVEAVVPGAMLDEVVEVPRVAIRGQDELWVENDGVLKRREVEILRSRREVLIVRADFEPGDRLVLTRLDAPLVGMKVNTEVAEPGAQPEGIAE